MTMLYKKSNILGLLIVLGKEGALDKECNLTTSYLAEKLDVSQQTASRWLEDLHSEGYVEKTQSGQGLNIKFTEKGINDLQKVYFDLKFVFSDIPSQIRGELSKGLGEGGYYISLSGYMDQFIKILGWRPYAGTLNIKLILEEDQSAFDLLASSPYKLVNGFHHEETKRDLGKVFLHNCEIHYANNKKTEGAIIRPDRTHHNGIMEVLAPFYIRGEWNLHDGDTIIVKPISIS